ncbi:MAG: rhodanese-like domain-containing protein [Spirochaetia bacterium]|nr:rhodanese-like domain-containing protein [Spirochaetia bacterium]MDY3886997.1 rhodanese-like domain-containing protein [Treponema sp.]
MKNLKKFCTILLFALINFSCATKENQNPQKKEGVMNSYISVSMENGLKMLFESKNAVLLDVRRIDEYKAGHIPESILFTNETMTQEKAEKLIPSKNTKIFVYCRSGRRSKEASKKLIEYGYKNVVEIGGILDYSGKLEN